MNLFRKTIYSLTALAATSVLEACDSFLQEYSQDLAKVETWEDLDELLVGEGYFQSGSLDPENGSESGENIDFLHFMTDEVTMTGGIDMDISNYYDHMFPYYTWQSDTGVNNKFNYQGGDEETFNLLYRKINVCNSVIALADDQPIHDPKNDPIQKRRIKGEAQFLRAFYYFMLTNLYAEPYNPSTAESTPGVPLKFTENVEDIEFTRSSLKECYGKIIEDLTGAMTNLEGITGQSIYFADKRSAEILLARVYLYMQDHKNAAVHAEAVIDTDRSLLNLHTVSKGSPTLVASNPEIIFTMGSYEIAYSFHNFKSWYPEIPLIEISQYMLGLYTRDDLRMTRYIGKTERGGYARAFIKYDGFSSTYGKWYETGSVFTLRNSEAYLILAESQAMLGKDDDARNTLKTFLSKRMSGEYTLPQSNEELIRFIREENAREFLIEGHRWFDLRRYTVDMRYPWSKEISHPYPYQDNYKFDHFEWYRLEKNDAAYTLPIPRKILQFQISLGSVARPERKLYDTTYEMEYEDDEDDDY
ncbi:RagB/SusD family nutrient uptake outer membrane protein [Duncaniella freteri]|uniref:RagB/SusD family nutrient uptake outer membrane protein n=1 Tax=Duncaniella freteri TaxID=2530391 RepID=UPI0025751775|nr:RagB/SusD family nutrient uptake outer membrane protein [Duncaniella freteri]